MSPNLESEAENAAVQMVHEDRKCVIPGESDETAPALDVIRDNLDRSESDDGFDYSQKRGRGRGRWHERRSGRGRG